MYSRNIPPEISGHPKFAVLTNPCFAGGLSKLQTSSDLHLRWYIPRIHRINHGSYVYAMMMTSHCTKHRWYIQHILQRLTSHRGPNFEFIVLLHALSSANSALWGLCDFCFVYSNYVYLHSTLGIAWLLLCLRWDVPPWRYIHTGVCMLNTPPVFCSVTSSSWYIIIC